MTADQNVDNLMNGAGPAGALPEALVAMLYNANILGLNKDYARPEGSNTSSSRYDHITTLAKLLTRKRKMADGNSYDLWDAIMTIAKVTIAANPHINDDEPNSINYKKPTTS